MDTKYSKAPWMVTLQGPADADGIGICSMWGESTEVSANANLIATAPDMYEFIETHMGGYPEAEDLLAKARGEQ